MAAKLGLIPGGLSRRFQYTRETFLAEEIIEEESGVIGRYDA